MTYRFNKFIQIGFSWTCFFYLQFHSIRYILNLQLESLFDRKTIEVSDLNTIVIPKVPLLERIKKEMQDYGDRVQEHTFLSSVIFKMKYGF